MCSNNYKWVDGEIATYAIWYECNVWLPQNEWNWSCERCRKRVEWSNFSQAWMIQAVIYFNRMSEWVSVCGYKLSSACALHFTNMKFFEDEKNRRDWEREEEKRILIYLTIRYIFLSWINHEIYIFLGIHSLHTIIHYICMFMSSISHLANDSVCQICCCCCYFCWRRWWELCAYLCVSKVFLFLFHILLVYLSVFIAKPLTGRRKQ